MQSYDRRRGLSLAMLLGSVLAILVVPCVPVPSLARQTLKHAAKPAESADSMWMRGVEPLLDKYCVKCHAAVKQYGGLDLRSLETILHGGARGPAVIPGKPDESRLLQVVAPKAATHMPPDPKRQLSAGEIAVLRAWVARLPVAKSALASGTSKNNSWVPDYLAEYRRTLRPSVMPPAALTTSAAIDWFLETKWREEGIEPAKRSSDAVFMRRIYLDVAGRIPSREELGLFLADTRADKRERLVDKLLASNEYPRHMREVFDTVLMGRPDGNSARERVEQGWTAFLEESFRENRPWNEIVRDLLVARPAEGARRGAFWFLAERKDNHQAIAEAVAPVTFGVQVKCAQCHNHPLVWEIEQRHYWGLVAAFNRSKNISTEAGPAVTESATGGFINFANLKKESQPAVLLFLNGKNVPERIPGANEKEMDTPDLYVIPPAKEGQKAKNAAIPKFSRREAFADAATRDNPALARAFVNRMWAKLMGRGIVHPVDQIDSRHHPSHPGLLEWLARDFERSGYDVRRLVRNIVLTRAYQLDAKAATTKPPRPETFARALEKPLTAEQLLRSLWVATGNKTEGKEAGEMERTFAKTFPDVMPDNYSPSLQQALFLSNSSVVDGLLKPTKGSTTARLLTLATNGARVREAFKTVLGRSPDVVELQRCQSLLDAGPPERGVPNLLWALLTCAEFQVNH